jgi:UDP:flavonoid glycosyltransferase YjiC (YdhE family)
MGDHTPMRILVSTTPGVGHLLPMLPVARAARDRGHEVVIAGGASVASIIAAAGFRHELVGPATIGEMFGGLPDIARLPARDRALITMPKVFCERIAPAMAEGVAELVERWPPGVIVHENMEFGSGIVAEQVGIPHVVVQATAWRPHLQALGNDALGPLRERRGLTRDVPPERLLGRLFFTTRPRSLRDPDAPLPEVTAELRPIADDRGPGDEAAPADPFPPRDGRARVVITLGTVNNAQLDLLRTMIDGAVAAGAHVVVALGADPASLGPVPAGVAVHAYVPMSTVLPVADVVAYHGGSGTMLAALAAGTPMVIIPLAADQPDNGDRCEAAGVARVVPLEGIDAAAVRAALEAIASDPTYRDRARAVADEIAAMPGPEVAVDRLESLVGWRDRATTHP